MKRPFLSIVINFYNEKPNIDMAPKCLTNQSYRNFEVIFVDDGSSDGSLSAILQKYQKELPAIKTLQNDFVLGLRKARNQGVKAATGDITITLDLHTTFDNLFLERIVIAFESSSRIGAVGAMILPYGKSWYNNGWETFNKSVFELRKVFRKYDYVFGTAAAYRSDILKEIGYLSEGGVVEDTDASWKIGKAGYKIVTLKNNLVYHKGPQTFRSFFKSFLRDGIRASIIFTEHKSKIIYPQFFLRIILLPAILLLIFFFPIQCAYLICGGMPLLLMLGFYTSRNLRKAVMFIPTTILFLCVTSLSLDLGLILSLLGKISLSKKIGIDW